MDEMGSMGAVEIVRGEEEAEKTKGQEKVE